MTIKHKKTVDRQKLGAAQKRMDAARAFAAAEMKELRERRAAAGAKHGEGRTGGWHIDAVMNAVATEGPDVLSGAAAGYWDDMRRLYPEMCADGAPPGTDSANGRKNRLGVVKLKWIRGVWHRFDKKRGEWIPENEDRRNPQ